MPDKAPSPDQLSLPSGSPCVFFGPVSIPQIAWLFPAGPPSILRVSTHHCSLPIRTLILPIASQFPEYAPVSPASTHSLCVRCDYCLEGSRALSIFSSVPQASSGDSPAQPCSFLPQMRFWQSLGARPHQSTPHAVAHIRWVSSLRMRNLSSSHSAWHIFLKPSMRINKSINEQAKSHTVCSNSSLRWACIRSSFHSLVRMGKAGRDVGAKERPTNKTATRRTGLTNMVTEEQKINVVAEHSCLFFWSSLYS